VGLLFHPRRPRDDHERAAPPPRTTPFDREAIFMAALEAVVLGDASRFAALFSDDVVCSSPHVKVASMASLLQALGAPEDALSDVAIVLLGLHAIDDTMIGEWRLEAMFTRPVLFDDRWLIEPTGGPVHMTGASIAEFDEHRIRAFRHYFDDSELFTGVPGTPEHLRWSSRG
jgi:ketosteroid isomerase-like protein